MTDWERDQREYADRKEDSIQAVKFLFWLMLGVALFASVKAIFEWLFS